MNKRSQFDLTKCYIMTVFEVEGLAKYYHFFFCFYKLIIVFLLFYEDEEKLVYNFYRLFVGMRLIYFSETCPNFFFSSIFANKIKIPIIIARIKAVIPIKIPTEYVKSFKWPLTQVLHFFPISKKSEKAQNESFSLGWKTCISTKIYCRIWIIFYVETVLIIWLTELLSNALIII